MSLVTPCWSLALLLVSAGAPPSSTAAPARPAVAVLPVVGKLAPAVTQSANQTLAAVTPPAGGELWAGKLLRQKVKKDPAAQAKRCRGEASCLATLAKKAGATHVLSTQVLAPGSAQLQLRLIDAAAGTVVGEATVAVGNDAYWAIELKKAAERLLAVLSRSPEAPVAPAPPATEVAGPAEPAGAQTADVTAGPTPASAAAPPVEVVLAQPTPVEPGEAAPATEAEVGPGPSSPHGPTVSGAVSWSYTPTWRTWLGGGSAAAGIAMLVGGSLLGTRADELKEVAPRATQVEVVDQERRQHLAAGGSTALYLVGSVALVAGVGLVGWDWWAGHGAVSVIPTAEGGSAVLSWAW